MSVIRRLGDVAPYTVILCGALGLYYVAEHIAYTAIPNQMGPDLWPKIVLGILVLLCAFEMLRRLAAGNSIPGESSEAFDVEEDLIPHHEIRPSLVVATVMATVAYLLLLNFCGFFTCTFFYTGALMWFGGVRKPPLVAAISLALSFFFAFIFMKLIFVALPLGEGPFAKISLLVMTLVGVH